MIFKINESAPPLPGSTRTKVKFAWWPVRIGGAKVWLESYEILESYIVTEYQVIVDNEYRSATIGNWKEISKRFIKWKRIINE
jgi:hypothetical protein